MFRSSIKTPPAEVLPGVNTLVKISIMPPATAVATVATTVATAVATTVTTTLAAGTTTGSGFLELPTRVEDVDHAGPSAGRRARVYVAAPHYPGDLEGPEPGCACRVIWATARGLCLLPTRYTGHIVVGSAVRAWRLTVDGPVARVQRRRYFRVPWIGPVTLEVTRETGPDAGPDAGSPDAGSPGADTSGNEVALPEEGLQVLTGVTVDLSEGGLLVTLPEPGLPDRTAIRVLLPVHDQVLVLPATTVWSRPAPPPAAGLVQTGISFDDVEDHGDLLRRVVVDVQLRARRIGLV